MTHTQLGLAAGFFLATRCARCKQSRAYRFGARLGSAPHDHRAWCLGDRVVTGTGETLRDAVLLGSRKPILSRHRLLSAWFPREYRTRCSPVCCWASAASLVWPPFERPLEMRDIGTAVEVEVHGEPARIVLGFVVLRFCGPPADASWLTREEDGALLRCSCETHDRPKNSIIGALSDVRVWFRARAVRVTSALRIVSGGRMIRGSSSSPTCHRDARLRAYVFAGAAARMGVVPDRTGQDHNRASPADGVIWTGAMGFPMLGFCSSV